jgi:succinate dehydrogenase / fumarate reductase cytochrome b subunit
MALTGCALVLFLLFHMSMNLVLVISRDAYDSICEFLGTNWYAIAGSLLIAGLFVLHILFAVILTWQNGRARGSKTYESANETETEWSAKNMFVLGLCVLAFLGMHLVNFWYKMQFSELMDLPGAEKHGSVLAVELFANPVFVALYVLGIIALWFHLSHGVWSMLQSTGMSGKLWLPRIKVIGNIVAAIVCAGFAAVPVFYYIKSMLN